MAISSWHWWTIAYWCVTALMGLSAAYLLYRGLLHDRSRGRPRCPRCWYDMIGSPALVCPECGHDTKTQRRLHKTRRHRWPLAFALLMIASIWYGSEMRWRMTGLGETWRSAALPTTYFILAPASDFGILFRRHHDPQQPEADNLSTRRGLIASSHRHTYPQPPPDRSRLWRWQQSLAATRCRNIASQTSSPHRTKAVAMLGVSARRSDRAMDALAALAQHRESWLHRDAMWEICNAGPRAMRAFDLLTRALNNEFSRPAQYALSRLGPAQFDDMPDEQLRMIFLKLNDRRARDLYLNEMIRRGPTFLPFLEQVYDTSLRGRLGPHDPDPAVLIARRRIEGKPQPLQIYLQVDEPVLMRSLHVRIKNADVDGEVIEYLIRTNPAVHFIGTPSFDSLRRAPRKPPLGIDSDLGPLRVRLRTGESVDMHLDLEHSFKPPPPGEYLIVVEYPPGVHEHRIVARSKPIRLIIRDDEP